MKAILAALGAAFLLTVPASAQRQQPRLIDVPAASAWQHAATGMILPSRSAGVTRAQIRDATDGELDVTTTYEDPAGDLITTVYLFQTMLPAAPMWFDRALTALVANPQFALDQSIPAVPISFTPPKASAASGLRASLGVNSGGFRSTAVALAPLGPWMVKLRMSSRSLDRAALDQRLSAFIGELRWPAEVSAPPVAAAIQPCAEPLKLKKARLVSRDLTQTLIDAAMSVTVAERAGKPPTYCRESGPSPHYGVYRPDASKDQYVVALGDSGTALVVKRAFDLAALDGGSGGGRRYSLSLLKQNATEVLPSFNRLPPPDQAIGVVLGGKGPGISLVTQ